MVTARVDIPEKLISVFLGAADVRGSYGGRGSAKTMTFAKMCAVNAYRWSKGGIKGIILCGRQYMNSLDDSSLGEIKAAIRSEPWLEDHFDIGEKYIRTKNGNVEFKFVGLDRNIESVKSKTRILLCWVDEAEQVVDYAWSVLIPTIRGEGSELWVTWNPKSKNSSTNKRFRETQDPLYKIVEMNWRDNPRFTDKLNRDRLRDLEHRPDQYPHVWEGEYLRAIDGAYYSKSLAQAKLEGRIGRVAADPLMTVRLFVDIGGTGAKADSFSMWAAQFIGKEIRVLNYYEAQGQPLATHLAWMRSQGYHSDRAQVWLPHDGGTHDRVYDVSYESALKDAGYEVTIIPNQGKGAAMARVESVRRLFPSIWINEQSCASGIDALGWYHERKDEVRNVGLGPEHDWASHGADAFGLMCVAYEEPQAEQRNRPTRPLNWMG